MGTKNNPGNFNCHAAADPDEPIFTFRATDRLAPGLIEVWVLLRSKRFNALPDAMVALEKLAKERESFPTNKEVEAIDCAAAMREWRKTHA